MKIYLDTNILRDCLKNRKPESVRLMEIIRTKKIPCVTSAFTMMELMDIEKEHSFFLKKIMKGLEINKILRTRNDRDLNTSDLNEITEQIKILRETYGFVELIVIIKNEGWQVAVDICNQTNISAPDSLHLASAIGSGCNFFITSDNFLKKEGNKFFSSAKTPKGSKINFKIIEPNEAIKEIEK